MTRSRPHSLIALVPALSLLGSLACGSGSGSSAGHGGSSGESAVTAAGASSQAGSTALGGATSTAGMGNASAGSLAGGAGASSGGASSVGGANGGATLGGASNAGASSAGTTSGGSANGGSANGGSANGGSANGGSANGGGANGGGATTVCGSSSNESGAITGLPKQAAVLQLLRLSNDYFVAKWPDPSVAINASHASNIWTRAVYYEGLMGLYGVETDATRKASYYDYAVKWGASASHPWQLAGGGTTTRSADNQCCGQTYIDLYQIDAQAVRVHDIKADIDAMVASTSSADWTWVDAIQMSMPVFAKLGIAFGDNGYFTKMHALYENAKVTQGFYNTTDHLWWRDKTFEPPFTTPSGKQCYWSRGNGWAFAALARVLSTIPSSAANRAEYVADFQAMAAALQKVQRSDGFWNVSLADPNDHGGPESTGTALFVYGMAWGVRSGLLDATSYTPTIAKGWCGLMSAVHSDGALGYAQGSGSKPADGQPVTFDSVPDYADFPLGCLLLAGSEVWKLATP